MWTVGPPTEPVCGRSNVQDVVSAKEFEEINMWNIEAGEGNGRKSKSV